MGIFNFFKQKERPGTQPPLPHFESKYDIYAALIREQQENRSSSDVFVSGAVFDVSRQWRQAFLQSICSHDAGSVNKLFADGYLLFLNKPEEIGLSPLMVPTIANDTDPRTWNVSVFNLADGDYAALLFMPVQDAQVQARIAGIIFSSKDDGYYYCTLSNNEDTPSVVYRNTMLHCESIGEVTGRGFELMNSFLSCITNDFCREG